MVNNKLISKLSNYNITESERKELLDICEKGIDYKFYSIFQQKGIYKTLFGKINIPMPSMGWFLKTPWAKTAKTKIKKQILSAEHEKTLFLQYNWCKYKIAQHYLNEQADGCAIIHFLRQKNLVREKIVGYNLALVMNLVRRAAQTNLTPDDMISTGSMILLAALEKFDTMSGNKFSTYLTWSISRALAKESKKEFKLNETFSVCLDTSNNKDSNIYEIIENKNEACCTETADLVKRVVIENLAGLSDIELKIIKSRYPLHSENGVKTTLQDLCTELGISKMSLNKMEKNAINKIREKMLELDMAFAE